MTRASYHRFPYAAAVGIIDPESISAMGGRKFAVTDENTDAVGPLYR
jgi:uncharacterized protein YjiK